MASKTAPLLSSRQALQSFVGTLARFAGARGALAAGYVLLGALFESIGLVLLIPLFTLVIGNGAGNGRLQHALMAIFDWFAVSTPFGRLSLMLGVFSILMIVRGIVITLRDTSVAGLQIEFIEHLRDQVAQSLANSDWEQVLKLRHARILNVMSADLMRINGMAHFVIQAGISLTILIAQCALSFVLSPSLALFSFSLLVVGAVAMAPVLRRARALGRVLSDAQLILMDSTSQFLSGLKLALSQNLQNTFVSEFRDTLHSLTSRQLHFVRQQTAGRVILTTLTAVVGAAVILVGYGVLHLSAPLLIAFLLVVARMSGPAGQLQQGLQQLAHGLPAYESVSALVTDLRAAAAARAAVSRELAFGSIAIESIVFQHPHTDESGSHGVRGISLRIEPGSFLGLAGTSGAGKTTLADLLVGLLRPQSGRILIGGSELNDETLAGWRAQISYISQDPFLFHDTVRRNLHWARPGASETEMWEALEMAGAGDIVRRMDGGLDAMVGERGSLVSGGERQRIALARALLRKPRLLVMDEATNAIDIAGERHLLERLKAMQPRPTVVMIAHRAESLALCDRIVHMDNGLLDATAPPLAAVR